MPIQKDLKKIVRARMEKTGEAYTTARLHVVSKKIPPPNYAGIAGVSDAALLKNTGRDWAEWVPLLDAINAHEKPHREYEHIAVCARKDSVAAAPMKRTKAVRFLSPSIVCMRSSPMRRNARAGFLSR